MEELDEEEDTLLAEIRGELNENNQGVTGRADDLVENPKAEALKPDRSESSEKERKKEKHKKKKEKKGENTAYHVYLNISLNLNTLLLTGSSAIARIDRSVDLYHR